MLCLSYCEIIDFWWIMQLVSKNFLFLACLFSTILTGEKKTSWGFCLSSLVAVGWQPLCHQSGTGEGKRNSRELTTMSFLGSRAPGSVSFLIIYLNLLMLSLYTVQAFCCVWGRNSEKFFFSIFPEPEVWFVVVLTCMFLRLIVLNIFSYTHLPSI